MRPPVASPHYCRRAEDDITEEMAVLPVVARHDMPGWARASSISPTFAARRRGAALGSVASGGVGTGSWDAPCGPRDRPDLRACRVRLGQEPRSAIYRSSAIAVGPLACACTQETAERSKKWLRGTDSRSLCRLYTNLRDAERYSPMAKL